MNAEQAVTVLLAIWGVIGGLYLLFAPLLHAYRRPMATRLRARP